jgi:hypothetical protein
VALLACHYWIGSWREQCIQIELYELPEQVGRGTDPHLVSRTIKDDTMRRNQRTNGSSISQRQRRTIDPLPVAQQRDKLRSIGAPGQLRE